MSCQNLREQQSDHHPQNPTCDVHQDFCGGGARIVGFEHTQVLKNKTFPEYQCSSFCMEEGILQEITPPP